MRRITTIMLLLCTFVLTAVADELPYKTTSISGGQFASNTEWYYLKINDKYLACDDNGRVYVSTELFTDQEGYKWCFEGNSMKFRIFNKKKGTSAALGHAGLFDPNVEKYKCTFIPKGSYFYHTSKSGIYVKNFLINEYLSADENLYLSKHKSNFVAITNADLAKIEEDKKEAARAEEYKRSRSMEERANQLRKEREASYETPFSITAEDLISRLEKDFVKNGQLTPKEYVGYRVEYVPEKYSDGISVKVSISTTKDLAVIAVFKNGNGYEITTTKTYNRKLIKERFENSTMLNDGNNPSFTVILKDGSIVSAESSYASFVTIDGYRTKSGRIGKYYGEVTGLPVGAAILKLTSIDQLKVTNGVLKNLDGSYISKFVNGEECEPTGAAEMEMGFQQWIVDHRKQVETSKNAEAKKQAYNKMIAKVGQSYYNKLTHNQIPIGISIDQLNAYREYVVTFFAPSEHHIKFEFVSSSGSSIVNDVWITNEDGKGNSDISLHRVYFQNRKVVRADPLKF